MQTIYIVQQGNSDYDGNFYYIKDAEFGKIVGTFLFKKEAEELQQKLINYSYNLFKDKIHCIDFEDYFDTYKRLSEVEDYEKLEILLNVIMPEHVQIKEYDLDDSSIVHSENKSPLKKYCSWNTTDADTCNKQEGYIDMDYDNPKYENVLEAVMDIAEDKFDAGYGLSWQHIDWAWEQYLRINKLD